MLFCPECGTILLITDTREGQAFSCRSCPYTFHITQPVCSRVELPRKRVEDVFGGADAWKNVDSIAVQCPKCEHPRAYYMQIQIRSADEPSSIFYKCCSTNCGHLWREG